MLVLELGQVLYWEQVRTCAIVNTSSRTFWQCQLVTQGKIIKQAWINMTAVSATSEKVMFCVNI